MPALLVEDCFDDGGLLGCAGAEVARRGVKGGVAEQGLDLGGIGAALAQPGGVGVPEPVRPETLKSRVFADGTTWVRAEVVSRPRCPVHSGPCSWPRCRSHARCDPAI